MCSVRLENYGLKLELHAPPRLLAARGAPRALAFAAAGGPLLLLLERLEELRRLREIAGGVDPKNAGKKSRYKKGYARPKPKNDKGTRKRRTLNKKRS